jgi:transposase-like protein
MPNRVLNRIDTRVAYLEQINRVYDYYKHATLGDTAKKFGKTKTQIKIWIRKIEKDHSNNKLRGSSLRAHTTKKKKEIIFYARRYGYSATMSKFFVPKYKIII